MAYDDLQVAALTRVGAHPNTEAELNGLMATEGFMRQPIHGPSHDLRVIEAARLMADVINGRAEPHLISQAFRPTSKWALMEMREKYPNLLAEGHIGLRETMSYSDYSALTVDVLDRVLYGYYTAAPITNLPLVKKVPLRDFRYVARYEMDGATKPWSRIYEDTGLPATPSGAGEPPTERSMVQSAREVPGPTARITYKPELYQGKMSVNWRALVNDDLGIFQDMTQRLAIGGRRTIYSFITSLYVASTGPHPTLYNSTFANLVTPTYGASSTNPPLSIQGLQDAINVLERQLDLDGQPITFEGQLYLWYGPSFEVTARNILKAVLADISVMGGTTNVQGFPSQRLQVQNWVVQNMIPIQDKYIRLVCTTSGIRDTMWGLTYDPNSQARPSLELGFLNGFDSPQLFQKVPNTMRVGGGVDPMLGDFYTMDQEFKGVLVMGGSQNDGRSTVASTGAGV